MIFKSRRLRSADAAATYAPPPPSIDDGPAGSERATFAAGCFWGIEAAFRDVDGVTQTAVGYTDGHTTAPTYEQVCAAALASRESEQDKHRKGISTDIAAASVFYRAEEYHQRYFEKSGRAACAVTLRRAS
jgi:peptide methionine sulfoxide reductase MsrA